MSILGWIFLGLVAGAIAKAIMPGEQGGGWIVTIILGIVGAILGGFLASLIFKISVNNSIWELRTLISAVVGSLIVLFVWGKLRSKGA